MKPLFTIHEGEYLLGARLESHEKKPSVWVPTKDRGVDFLVTDEKNQNITSIQVKFSKDFLVTHESAAMQEALVCCGWWTLSREKIIQSNADYWVFVLYSFQKEFSARGDDNINSYNTIGKNRTQYIVIRPEVLLQKLRQIHGDKSTYQTYLWVTQDGKCFETRGYLKKAREIAIKRMRVPEERDFTPFLDNNLNQIFFGWS